jgi:ribokinase
VVGFQLESDLETVIHGLRSAHGTGPLTFLDPAPAIPLSDDVYRYVDIIKPNETEASALTGIAVNDVPSAIAAGSWFRGRGVGTALVTLGAAGTFLVSADRSAHFPAPSVQAIDSTGAGDIFSGAFLSALASGRGIDDAIVFANTAAALSTERVGVVESIPEPAAVYERLQADRQTDKQ